MSRHCDCRIGYRTCDIGHARLPESVTKNKEARIVVLNDTAQSIIEEVRGEHAAYVFTWVNRKGRRVRLTRMTNSGWKAARRRAAARYEKELKRPLPPGFRRVRVHDLRHVRPSVKGGRGGAGGPAGRAGPKSGRLTTHYSAAEIGNLLAAVNRIGKSRETPASTVLRIVG